MKVGLPSTLANLTERIKSSAVIHVRVAVNTEVILSVSAKHERGTFEGLMIKLVVLAAVLTSAFADAQLQQYRTVDPPRAGENIDQPCKYQASFPARKRLVKAAWVTYDRGPDITKVYSDPEVLAFAEKNDLAMVVARQRPATRTSEKDEM